MNKQLLAKKLWDSADELRGKMDASEYKNYILGLLFYKFLSEHEENYLKSNNTTFQELDPDTIETVKEDLGYFIAEKDLFSTWLKNIKAARWGIINVTDALTHFRENLYTPSKDDFDGIFQDLNLTSEKLGGNPKEKEVAIRKLLELLSIVNITGNRDYDTFGFIYEYLIAQFAMASGKKAGEFYTPHEVSKIMASIVSKHLKTKKTSQIYDPTVGSGSLLLTLRDATSKSEANHNIKFYGQENNSTTYNIARMNLLMRGVKPSNMRLRNADTLKEDWPHGIIEGKNDPLFVDAVVANPPYSQKWDAGEHQLKDPRFRDYGVAPTTKADYAFLLHSLYHLKSDGVMAIILPHGVLFRGNDEEKIRKELLLRGQIDAIIGLPAGIFTNTGIPTVILILNKTKRYDNVFFIDASKGFKKEKSSNVLRDRDIKKILDAYDKRENIEGFARCASLKDIEANGYNLNIPRYVNSSDKVREESIAGHLQGGIPEEDINEFSLFWDTFPNLKQKLFSPLRKGFFILNTEVDKIHETIQSDSDYSSFVSKMNKNITAWEKVFIAEAIELYTKKSIEEIGTLLEDELFVQFSKSPFTDPYEAYQLFADQWKDTINIDLEMMREPSDNNKGGYDKARELEPNMVMKTKNGKKEEIQDGLKGTILPKELIAKTFFSDKLSEIEELRNDLADNEGRLAEIIEEINEESLLYEFLNDNEKLDAASYKKIKARIAELKDSKDSQDKEDIAFLKEVAKLPESIKKFKSDIKDKEEELNTLVEAKYPKLTVEEIKDLLHKKWLGKLIPDLNHIIDSYSMNLSNTVKELDKHYSCTLNQIQQKRKEAEKSFWDMAAQLVDTSTCNPAGFAKGDV